MLLFYFIFIESKDTTLFRNNQEILKKSCVEERNAQILTDFLDQLGLRC